MSPAGQQKNPNINEVGENTPKLNFGRNNNATQEIEPKKMSYNSAELVLQIKK